VGAVFSVHSWVFTVCVSIEIPALDVVGKPLADHGLVLHVGEGDGLAD